ncbi:MAG: DUF1573 domain-containing protein [Prevotellaceae bacterium]|nr:DUF1573 domain-containing protein [Prevotellaceae bacterium]
MYLFQKEKFDYPVYIDRTNSINRLNHFPAQIEFQCFLLDSNNKVLSIGNPTLNPKVWELYKQIITGEEADKIPVTTVEPQQTEIKITDLQVGKTSEAAFVLKNTGTQPLVIQAVNASCGCTVPEWEKQPIAAGKSTEIKVKITPEEKGYFHKTVTVHCNTEAGSIVLNVSGTAAEP